MFHHCKPHTQAKVLPAQVCPGQQSVQEKNCDYIVPVVHPSHTTNVVNHRYNFQHSYPHTESTVNRITNQHSYGPPAQVAGAATGPGFAPQVAGAATGPGYGPRPQVAGYGPGSKHSPHVAGMGMNHGKC
ncbi:CotD family spore coat protein [Salipaludibacillus sp. CF4.18]|uniref:CotD family spore coat protein n=1 Tax=Salipaludibacillus sp. CF4.18 TaxID=3373081 RepID=UPI003EE75958